MNTKNKFATRACFVFGVFIFLYSSIRAYVLSITWDEAYSYLQFIKNKVFWMTTFNTMSANNHLLNTFLCFYFTKWFGVSEFVLRVPSLITHIIFLLFSAKLILNFENKWLIVSSFLIINLNPYVLDFFSLSRGYGFSLAFMVMSIYYFQQFFVVQKKKYLLISLIFAVFALFSNLILLNFFISLFAVIIFYFFLQNFLSKATASEKIISFLKLVLPFVIISTIVLVIVLPIIFKMKNAGALFFGEQTNFYSSTISTLLDRSFYEIGYNVWILRFIKAVVFSTLILAISVVVVKILKKQTSSTFFFFLFLLFIAFLLSISSIAEHYFFQIPYLVNRTALQFILLFNLIFVFFVNEIAKINIKYAVLSYLSSILVVLHFGFALNFNYVLEWKFDADTKNMLADISKNEKKFTVATSNFNENTFEFYKLKQSESNFKTKYIESEEISTGDYFYGDLESFSKIKNDSFQIIKIYSLSNNVLAKKY